MRNISLIILSLVLMLFGCKKKELVMSDESGIDSFIGEYIIESNHISGIVTNYDSGGNIIYQGLDTTIVSNELIKITAGNTSDTLLINSLIQGLNEQSIEVKGILESDTLKVVYERSVSMLRNNYVRGNIWHKGDSIFLHYYWDKSDIWSSGALPERGEVEAKGIRL